MSSIFTKLVEATMRAGDADIVLGAKKREPATETHWCDNLKGYSRGQINEVDQRIWTALNWMDRGELENILQDYGFAVHPDESDDDLKQAIVTNIQDGTIDPSILGESAPEGWEGTVKAMKKDSDVDNPWALAHWMKNKGYKSHKKEAVGSRVKEDQHLTQNVVDTVLRHIERNYPEIIQQYGEDAVREVAYENTHWLTDDWPEGEGFGSSDAYEPVKNTLKHFGIDHDAELARRRANEQEGSTPGVHLSAEIYDNGGKTVDRYTVILKSGSVFGMSDNALSPNGFNQYAGEIDDLPGARSGQQVSYEDLPDAVKKAIENRMQEDWEENEAQPGWDEPDYEQHLPRRKAEFRDGMGETVIPRVDVGPNPFEESKNIRVWHPLHGKGTVEKITEVTITIEWDNILKRMSAPRTIALADAKYLERLNEQYSDDPDDARVGKENKRKEKIVKAPEKKAEKNKADESQMTFADFAFDFIFEDGNDDDDESSDSENDGQHDLRPADADNDEYINVPRPADSILTNQEDQPAYKASPLSTHDGYENAHNEVGPDGDYATDLVPNDAPDTPSYREMDSGNRKNTKDVGNSAEFTQKAGGETKDSGEKPEDDASSEEESKMKTNESLPVLTAEDLGLVVINENADVDECGDMGMGNMDTDMEESHDVTAGEVAFTPELLKKLLSAVATQSPDEAKLAAICGGLTAAQQEKGEGSLDVSDMEAIKAQMKAAATGGAGGDVDAGGEDDYDYDEDRAAADGQLAGPEGGEEHEGKTMMMDRKGSFDQESGHRVKNQGRPVSQDMKRKKPKKSQQYEAKGNGSSGTPVGQEVGGGPGGGGKTDLSKAKDWNGKALGDETGGGPGGGNKTDFGQKPSDDGGSNLLPASSDGSSLGAADNTFSKGKPAPRSQKPLAAEGRKAGTDKGKKRLNENIMLGLSAIPGTFLGGNSNLSQFQIDPDDPDAEIKQIRRAAGIEEWWKV